MYRSYERYYDPMNGYCKSEGMNLEYLYIDSQKNAHKSNYLKKLKKLISSKK